MEKGGFFFASYKDAQGIKQSEPSAKVHNVSSAGDLGRHFSPFIYRESTMPVPGLPGKRAHSVESVWQGLKYVNGKTAHELFDAERIKKRKVIPYQDTIFQFGGTEISLVSARKKIYVPTYSYMFRNNVNPEIIMNMLSTSKKGVRQYLHDVDENGNLNDPSSSYSHSALLTHLMNHLDSQQEVEIPAVIEEAIEAEVDLDTSSGLEEQLLKGFGLPQTVTNILRISKFEKLERNDQVRMLDAINEYYAEMGQWLDITRISPAALEDLLREGKPEKIAQITNENTWLLA